MTDDTPTPDAPHAASPLHPWEQQLGESETQYARFLLYRGLGLARSVCAAYAAYDEGAKGGGRRAPGSWHRDAVRWGWETRANQYDLHVLTEQGQIAVARYLAVLSSLSLQLLGKVTTGGLVPKTWADVLETVRVLGQHIPPDTILALAQSTRDAPPLPPQEPSP